MGVPESNTVRLKVRERAALVPGDRPAVLWIKGGVVYVAVHDVYYWKRRKEFRQRIFDLHPDRAGCLSRSQWATLQRDYDTWLREEKRWYAAIGLDVPRGERRPVENVFEATYRAVLMEAIRLAGNHGPTAADILGVSLDSLYHSVRRRGFPKGFLQGGQRLQPRGRQRGSVPSIVDAVAKEMPAPFRRCELLRIVAERLAREGRDATFAINSAIRALVRAGTIVKVGCALKADGATGKLPIFVHRGRFTKRYLRSGTHD